MSADRPRFGGHLGTCAALFGAHACTCDKERRGGYGMATGRLVRPYRDGTDLVTVSTSEWEETVETAQTVPDLQDALANERAISETLRKRLADERERIADYLLTYSGDGDAANPWQAGHNYAMREASRMVREQWTDLGSALTDPATPIDTKGGAK